MAVEHQVTNPDIISSVGLALDIVGVVLVYFFGIPSGAALDGVLTWRRRTGSAYRHSVWLSRLGLGLLIAAFGLQIASNHVGLWVPMIPPALSCL